MQKITKQQDVDYFIASDGRFFYSESQAKDWEQSIIDRETESSLTKMKMDFQWVDCLDGTWFLVGNERQREFLMRKYVHPQNHDYVNGSNKGKLNLGDWVAIRYEIDSYGERGRDGLVTLSFLLNEMATFIDQANQITVEGKY